MQQKDLEHRLNLIRNDREHGSRWLVQETITLLVDLAVAEPEVQPSEQMELLRRTARSLKQARPAMAALAGVVARIMHGAQTPEDVARQAVQVRQNFEQAPARIAAHARPLLHGTVLTHSLSGTVMEVFKACADQITEVIVLEGRPRYEGRETARELSKLDLKTTLITDAQAAIFLPNCEAILVGADSILAKGDVLNKAGTALLAWAARGLGLPFYVACETLKISPRIWQADRAQLEEKEPEEVLEQPLANVVVRNFYFDRTPAMLVTGVITETGLLDAVEIQRIASSLQQDPEGR